MPLTVKALLLIVGFWLYLTVSLAPIGFFLVAGAVMGHMRAAAGD
jgi:hypothetical protein